ncbi:MAG: tetratricopeptide repeat protein [Leptolyngbyaceae cyanobacterium SU_3_3]|nr:tetratricopeptide repeat protein [Leptolyngbyaceae cyanobacterium SU_3_3]
MLGEVDLAKINFQKALDISPSETTDEQSEKAAIIHNLAIIYAQQGQVEQAIALYQQSLEIKESIGNVQGKAATLHQMAGIYAQQGKVDQAINLFNQSLEIEERIGDVRGKAMTLWWLGHLAKEQGDFQTRSPISKNPSSSCNTSNPPTQAQFREC